MHISGYGAVFSRVYKVIITIKHKNNYQCITQRKLFLIFSGMLERLLIMRRKRNKFEDG